jgi:hypothetical protein
MINLRKFRFISAHLIIVILLITGLMASGCSLFGGSINYDGGKYTGDLIDGIPNGTGKWVGPDGTIYEGEWVDGKKQGKGIYRDADGTIKDGLWEQDEFVGEAE